MWVMMYATEGNAGLAGSTYTVCWFRLDPSEYRTLTYSSVGLCLYGVSGASGLSLHMTYQLPPLGDVATEERMSAVQELAAKLVSMPYPEALSHLDYLEGEYLVGR